MGKTKRERIPLSMVKVIDSVIDDLKKSGRYREPTRVEAFNIVADSYMKKQLFKRKRGF
jgi:hypothetical protein